MARFRDFLEKQDVTENATGAGGGAVAAGNIASSVSHRGSNKKGDKRKKKQETIFAMSAEAEGNVVKMGGEAEKPGLMSPQQLTVLRNRFLVIKKIDPESKTYKELTSWLDKAPDALLKQLAGANIMFVSKLAQNRVLRRGLDEGSDRIKGDPCWKGYKMVGKKKKGGKKVPNCVPESEGGVDPNTMEEIAMIRRRAGIDE